MNEKVSWELLLFQSIPVKFHVGVVEILFYWVIQSPEPPSSLKLEKAFALSMVIS